MLRRAFSLRLPSFCFYKFLGLVTLLCLSITGIQFKLQQKIEQDNENLARSSVAINTMLTSARG